MTNQQEAAAKSIRTFITLLDDASEDTRRIAARIRNRLQRALYRHERDDAPEWVDMGGES